MTFTLQSLLYSLDKRVPLLAGIYLPANPTNPHSALFPKTIYSPHNFFALAQPQLPFPLSLSPENPQMFSSQTLNHSMPSF